MRLPPDIANQERILHIPRSAALQGVVMVGRYNFSQAQGELKKHMHEGAFEFCYLDKGQQTYTIDGEYYHLKGGDCFMTYPDEVHSSGEFPQDKNILYWLAIRINDDTRPLVHMPVQQQQALRKSLNKIVSRHFRGNQKLKEHLDAILETFPDRTQPLRPAILSNRIISFILEFISAASQPESASVPDPIQRALNIIQSSLGEDLSIPRLAASVELSEAHFKATFKEYTGIPPAEYVQRKRVAEARRLLESTDRSITEIAYSLGFNSSQYFATVFKRYQQVSPKAYRDISRD